MVRRLILYTALAIIPTTINGTTVIMNPQITHHMPVGHQFHLIAESADEYGYYERTSGQTKFHRNADTWECDRYRADYYTKEYTDK